MKKKVKAVIQARMGSTRLKNKTMSIINDKPMIYYLVERLKQCKNIYKIILATSENIEDDILAEYIKSLDISVVRGSSENVLSRYITAEELFPSEYTMRITGDNPFIAYEFIDEFIEFVILKDIDYSSITGLPIGLGAEIYKSKRILEFDILSMKWYCKEHVTPYFYENPDKYNIENYNIKNISNISARLTVDTKEDLIVIKKIFEKLYAGNPISTMEIINFCINNKDILLGNAKIKQRKYDEKFIT